MMKNIVYLILLICLTTNLFAQNQTSDCKFYLTLNKVEDQSWNSTDNLWHKINTKEFLYDNNGNAIQIINRSFTDLPSGLGNFRLTFTYENNILKTRQRDIWVNDSLLWIKDEKIEFNFSSQGDIISELWMTWSNDSNNWTSYWKKEYSYNDNRYLIEYQSFNKDNTSNQWQLDTKYIYSCDSIGNTIQTINYYQNKTTKELVESGKHEYKFDANGNCILHHAYYKYEDSTTWIKYGKDEYCYDSCNRMINRQSYTFND